MNKFIKISYASPFSGDLQMLGYQVGEIAAALRMYLSLKL